MTDKNNELLRLKNLIEVEMKAIGLWKSTLPLIEGSTGPFGGNSLNFEEWLQCIFLPNLSKVATSEKWPKKSELGIAAVRNFDGMTETDNLIELLGEVDDIINDDKA